MLKSVNDVPGLKRKLCPACTERGLRSGDDSYHLSTVSTAVSIEPAHADSDRCVIFLNLTLFELFLKLFKLTAQAFDLNRERFNSLFEPRDFFRIIHARAAMGSPAFGRIFRHLLDV